MIPNTLKSIIPYSQKKTTGVLHAATTRHRLPRHHAREGHINPAKPMGQLDHLKLREGQGVVEPWKLTVFPSKFLKATAGLSSFLLLDDHPT